ncbi:adenylyl-sulfate kinase [Pelagibacteraceae bacterium]|nr:adenylyl-sulfate kinase [Pelagibacteraceae bacterium]
MSSFSQIKIITCGSVDDGKSTLVGRILAETNNIFSDQNDKLKVISKRYGTTKGTVDYELLIDGLQDEREQGVTIDVAHKYINYKNKRLVFCDSPGHNQYTKNMVTAASNCSIGVILVDAAKGILEQTTRHLAILDFTGVEHVIFAINKIDTIRYNKKKIYELEQNIKKLLKNYSFFSKFIIPISALNNENIVKKSKKISWYKGRNLLDQIISIVPKEQSSSIPYITVQHVHRPDNKTRHYMGMARGHSIKNNSVIFVMPSKLTTKIKNIYFDNKKQNSTNTNYPVCIETANELDITRGDIIALKKDTIESGNFFNASVVITSQDNLYSGRQYLIRIHNKETYVTITKIKQRIDFRNNNSQKLKELLINDIGEIEFDTNDTIAFSQFDKIKELGAFIIIDIGNHNVVAAGKINFALRRSGNVFESKLTVSKKNRSDLIRQVPKCIWLTGISGSGKTTIGNALEQKLYHQRKLTYFIDADNIRLGINKDLGFSQNDRVENIRRIAEISKLMIDAGLIVIVATISPFQNERNFARSLFCKKEFYEIFVNTPLSVCQNRDSKNLYKKSAKDSSINKIGLGIGYEIPKNPDLIVSTEKEKVEEIADRILKKYLS